MDFIFILWYPKFRIIILSYALKQLIFILTCFTYIVVLVHNIHIHRHGTVETGRI